MEQLDSGLEVDIPLPVRDFTFVCPVVQDSAVFGCPLERQLLASDTNLQGGNLNVFMKLSFW